MNKYYITMEYGDTAFVVAEIKARTIREAWHKAGYPASEFPMMPWENRLASIDKADEVPQFMIDEFKNGIA